MDTTCIRATCITHIHLSGVKATLYSLFAVHTHRPLDARRNRIFLVCSGEYRLPLYSPSLSLLPSPPSLFLPPSHPLPPLPSPPIFPFSSPSTPLSLPEVQLWGLGSAVGSLAGPGGVQTHFGAFQAKISASGKNKLPHFSA